ncbi:MAG: hypothetical protein M3Y71_05715 [Actinomycetota bacterium]|nr:hypothetical protein [Actinomycetota bacterium]
MSISETVFDWRCRRAAHLLTLRDRRTLAAQLALYRSERDRCELRALVEHLDEDQTVEVRAILDSQDARARWRAGSSGAGMRCPAVS